MIRKCCAAAPSPLGEGWPKAGVCRISRSNCEAVNKIEGWGVSHRQTNALRRFSVGPSGLFSMAPFPAGVALRSLLACNPSPFQGYGYDFVIRVCRTLARQFF